MKKAWIFVTTLLVSCSLLAGCDANQPPAVNAEISATSHNEAATKERTERSTTEVTSSFLAGEESAAQESSQPSTSETTPPEAVSNLRPARQSKPAEETRPQPVQVEPVQTEAPAAVPEPTTPEEPAVESTAPPETTIPAPAPTEPPVPSFDVSSYVAYANSYAQSIGLSLDSAATACWDNPISASAKSQYLERDIRDLMDWYKASSYTAVCV